MIPGRESRSGCGNATGYLTAEYSLAAKWLELLKEIAPGTTRVAVLRDPSIASGPAQFAVIQSVAPSLGVDLRPIVVRDPANIERAITAFARTANGGMIVTASTPAVINRDLIIALAARYKIPAVYASAAFMPSPADWFRTGLISAISFAARPTTSIASSRAKNRPTSRCRRRLNTNWL
jgi:ABC-type uncharacterized transport system substrate-binding protein